MAPFRQDKVKVVPVEKLRKRFNNSPIYQKIQSGELIPVYLRDALIKNPRQSGNPPGTRSQLIRYIDSAGQIQAEIHQYLRPNGKLGGSGKPDPKLLRVGPDMLWKAELGRKKHQQKEK